MKQNTLRQNEHKKRITASSPKLFDTFSRRNSQQDMISQLNKPSNKKFMNDLQDQLFILRDV